MSRRLLAPLVVAAVVAGGTTAAALSWPVLPRVPGRPPPPTAAPVVERGLVCADVAADPGRVTTRASLAALPSPAGTRSAGRAAMTAVRGAATTPLPVLVGAGAVSKAEVARAAGPIRADAQGPLAAGVAAELLARIDAGSGRGLAETRCAVAAPDTWFVGGSTTVGSSASLLLVNPDEVVATADVSLMTAAGPVAPRSARGVEVPAQGSVRMALESLAPNVPALATHVAVTAGRLTATMFERRHLASLALGVDYVAPTAAPARAAVVPGLVAGPGARSVLLAVPGPDDASVELRVVTTDGSFVPAALNAVRVRAGTVVPVDLAKVLAGRPAAVVVSSDVPVLAGGFSAQGDAVSHEAEFAWTAATPPLGGAALLPDNRVRGAQRSVLLLTAPEASATVSLTGLSAGPQAGPGPVMIRVPAGRTIAVPLQVLRVPGGEFALVVTPMPGSGPIYGSRQLSEQRGRGVWLSQLTLERTEVTASVPTVVQDPAAGGALAGVVRRVDGLRVQAEQPGDLLDDHIVHEVSQLAAVRGASLHRPAVDHDPARRPAGARHQPGQRYAVLARELLAGREAGGHARHLVDRELHRGELMLPAALEMLHGVEHEVVELLRAAARQRYPGRHQRPAEPAAVPVPPPGRRRPAGRRGAAGLDHNREA